MIDRLEPKGVSPLEELAELTRLRAKNAGFSELTALMQKSLEEGTARIGELLEENAALAEQNAKMREVLEFYMENGITEPLYYKAKKALALPDLAALAALAKKGAEIAKHEEESGRVISWQLKTIERQAALIEKCHKALTWLGHRTADGGIFVEDRDLPIINEALSAIEHHNQSQGT